MFILTSAIASFLTIGIGKTLIFKSLPSIIRSDATFFNKESMDLKDYFCHDKTIDRFKDPHNLAKIENNIDHVRPNENPVDMKSIESKTKKLLYFSIYA
jgi:hypothetical protein